MTGGLTLKRKYKITSLILVSLLVFGVLITGCSNDSKEGEQAVDTPAEEVFDLKLATVVVPSLD